jgi:hypothetical protein
MGIAPDDGIPFDFTPETWATNQGFVDYLGREGVPQERAVTEEWITFVNRMTEHVVKTKPGFIVTTNGYANRAVPPEGVPLHPNLAIMYAGIWADTTKPLNSPKSWHGAGQGGQIKRWTELCPRVFLYEYNLTMLVTALTPVPQVRKNFENYRLYKQWGLWGFMNEARQPYFEEGIVTRYMRAQCMWNPDQDMQAALDDYYKNWYGPAASPARGFWDAIETKLLESPLLGHEDRILPYVYGADLVPALDTKIAEAEKVAPAEPYKTRVHVDRLTLEHLRLYLAYKAAEFDAKWDEAVAALDRMIAVRLELNKISPFLVMPPATKPPESYYVGENYWGVPNRKAYFETVRDATSGKTGELVALAPKTARFTLDDSNIGKDLRWYRPDTDRSKWRDQDPTQPFYTQVPGCLSERGVPYAGKMWYVFDVDVPASAAGKPVRLFSPFVTCEAWAWVNGEYAGHRDYLEAYISPAAIDLDVTKLIKPGAKNTIAVWVSTGTAKSQAPEGILGRVLLYSPKGEPITKS